MEAETTENSGNPLVNEMGQDQRAAAIAAIKKMRTEAVREEGANMSPSVDTTDVDARAEAGAVAPAAPDAGEVETPALNEAQKVKLRVRQEAQRIRAQVLKEKQEFEKKQAEFETERQRVAQEKSNFEQKMKELEDLRKRAREAPDAFLSEAGTSLDDIVRAKLEEGKPDARISQLERQYEALLQQMSEREKRAAEREQAEAEAKKTQEAEAQKVKMQELQLNAEKAFVQMLADNPEKYPMLSRVARKAPHAVISQGYAARYEFLMKEGREPTMDEIAANAENVYAFDDAPAAPVKRKGSVTSSKGGPTTPLRIEDMNDDQRRAEALKEMRRIRAQSSQ